MAARPVNVHNAEGEIIGLPRESGSDGEVIDGMVKEPEVPVVPGSENAPGSPGRRFENKRAERRRKEGGGEEG
jgi:hypothetical protein